jgi:hypothetical protein
MNKTEKTQVIDQLVEKLNANNKIYLADCSSLTVERVNAFRKACFDKKIKVTVVKNSLLKKALERANDSKMVGLVPALKGETALIFTDVANAPALIAFVPGLKSFEPIHINGRASTAQGLNATANTPFISYNGSEISGVDLKINTTDRGLQFTGEIQHITGIGHNLYHTQFNAIALNNKIDFNLDIDDKSGKDKYYLSGLLTQPTQGNYTINLRSDSLMLNYDKWVVSAGNSITITKDNIIANNFSLQKKKI